MSGKKLSGVLAVVLVAAFALGAACKKQDEAAGQGTGPVAEATTAQAPAGDAQAWFKCPMAECHYAQQGPGKCPKCGMELERVPDGWVPPGEPGACSTQGCCLGGAPAPTAAPQPAPGAAPAVPPEIKTAKDLAPERIGQTETCPIGGDTFTIAETTPAVSYNAKVVLFGCIGCAQAFAANPEHPTPPDCPHHGAH